MPIYKPSELRLFLNGLGVSPKKVLSQNFLIDGNIIRKIVESACVQPGDIVLEIGPGPGSLTEALLDKGVHVLAVEKDRVLARALERLKSPDNNLEIFCNDILEFPVETVLARYLSEGRRAKVIANLPYHLTTPILMRLISMRDTFSSLFVMVQEEVARRFTAMPGTSDYSSFTIFLNFYAALHYEFMVSRHCFFPEPNVQSAVVSLELKQPPTVSNEEQFFKTTRAAFSQRRKMLRASLRPLYATEAITKALIDLGFDPQSRPERLSLEDWLRFFERLALESKASTEKVCD